MATHSSILAWRIPWTEVLGGLQFMGLQRVRHDQTYTQHTHSNFLLSSLSNLESTTHQQVSST